MDDSRRTAAYRRTKIGGDEDVRVGSPLRKGHPVYWFHSGSHLRNQQGPLDEGIRQSMSPCSPYRILKASQGERGPARAV